MSLSETSSDATTAEWLSRSNLKQTVGDAELRRLRTPSTPTSQAQDADSNSYDGCGTNLGSPSRHEDGRGAGVRGPWAWHLVWCYERCHKEETAEKRAMLAQAAREAGAFLVCVKKAPQLAAWLKKTRCPPFVLLTDWREVKPCLQAAAEDSGCGVPAFTIIVCQEQHTYERARNWVRRLPSGAGRVYVLRGLSTAKAFLTAMARRMVGRWPPCPGRPSSSCGASLGPPSEPAGLRQPPPSSSSTSADRAPASLSTDRQEVAPRAVWGGAGVAATMQPAGAAAPMLPDAGGLVGMAPLLGIPADNCHPLVLERILQASKPDYYDD